MSYNKILKRVKEIDQNMEKMVNIKYILIPMTVLLMWFILLENWSMSFVFFIMIYFLIKLKEKYKKQVVIK